MPRPQQKNRIKWTAAKSGDRYASLRREPLSAEKIAARAAWRVEYRARKAAERTGPGIDPAKARAKRAAKDRPRTDAKGAKIVTPPSVAIVPAKGKPKA